MKTMKFFIVIIISILLFSCELDPEQYISVRIINNISEDLNVRTGTLFSAIYSVPKNSSYSVIGVKGVDITLTGKESGIKYGTRKFYSDGTWVVN
jgi:hypothetical protein